MKRVYAIGVFDLFHVGHLRFLEQAKKCGDILVVGVCSDDLCAAHKYKPVIDEHQRLEVVKALRIVDDAIIYNELKQTVYADVFAIGEDYGALSEHEENLRHYQESGTTTVRILRTPEISTTIIKERIWTSGSSEPKR